MTRVEAVTLAVRCLRELCREAGIHPVRGRLLEADFADLLWRVAEAETPEDWREFLERTDLRRKGP